MRWTATVAVSWALALTALAPAPAGAVGVDAGATVTSTTSTTSTTAARPTGSDGARPDQGPGGPTPSAASPTSSTTTALDRSAAAPAPTTTNPPEATAPASDAPDGSMGPMYVGAPWFEPGQPYAQNFPDPHVVWDGARYWAYATSTGGPILPAMWSTDLNAWFARDAHSPNPYNHDPHFNDAFPVPPVWSLGSTVRLPGKAQWGPGVARIGERWVAYTSWEVAPGRRCISAASATSPAGPFRDASPVPLQCDWDLAGSIDPEPFLDADGTPYLTWKSEGGPSPLGWAPTRIWARRLSPDGLSFTAEPPRALLETALAWEGPIIENPSMLRDGNGWWLLYSGGDWASGDYRTGVAHCAGPLGPCARTRDTPMLSNTATELGPGGGSLFPDPEGRIRIAYHAWNAPYTSYPGDPDCDGGGQCTSQGQRFLRIDALVAAQGTLTASPIGNVESVAGGKEGITVSGWALDPSALGGPSTVVVTVDGVSTQVVADGSRPDVGAAFGGFGPDHGFAVTVPAAGGTHRVCVAVTNQGAGQRLEAGCRTVTTPSGAPFGNLELVAAGPGSVTASGWVIDPDAADPVDVQVEVDGVVRVVRADRDRRDVGAAYPGYGSGHGFAASVPVSGGPHTVCVRAVNTGPGSNTALGCRTVVVPSGSPFGNLELVSAAPGAVTVAGWVLDPDVADPTDVHVYVDGVGRAFRADRDRPDVGAAYPGYGSGHGFAASVPVSGGPHTVCVYGINAGLGAHVLFACRTVVAPSGPPVGNVELVAGGPGAVSIVGWVLDPDVAAPTDVHVYVDGVGHAIRADGSRPDVGAAYPGYGSGHGFAAVVPAEPGPRTVCVYGINLGVGGHVPFGCRTVTVHRLG